METSAALGFGFRCGFLGLLHLEIIQERLAREFDLDLIATAPSVIYKISADRRAGRSSCTTRPTCRTRCGSAEIQEPWIRATILTPDEYLGAVLKLCQERRGVQVELSYVGSRAMVQYDLPLNEVVFDFYDRLEIRVEGLCQLRLPHHRLPRGRPRQDVDPGQRRAGRRALHAGAPLSQRRRRGRAMVEKLKELIPQHLFKIPIQAAIGAKVIARETISALRKDVTAKCYGGDITRKRKLLDKQKEGKKRCASSARWTSRRRRSSRR